MSGQNTQVYRFQNTDGDAFSIDGKPFKRGDVVEATQVYNADLDGPVWVLEIVANTLGSQTENAE